MVANLVWRIRYEGKSSRDPTTLGDDSQCCSNDVELVAIDNGLLKFYLYTLDDNICIFFNHDISRDRAA